ncbi:acyl CoA synthetase, long chain fatty acid:CoA ligase [Legionella birminghamensis]|uniref:Acyl CoA synthetase, long chain fatty acid:CoA ligase n=1 Tax=Legionella birminghamensis TaxID=28083 RepID=A0A378I6N6_9GAMM|nr:class I adenylate-forming enzyme family protein [Legionella birminghamensis]KTC71525.1 acyl CoA synthetase, long chain fatty acid:CoA ligase [Legionella birminghamensis]STX30867.1 acyl CoA synthetase, long chain fatty acid:CoA ligase [Legionella birminghamensis]
MLSTLLNESAAAFPDKLALMVDEQKICYAELLQLSNNLAASFLNNNIKEGDCVAFLLPNCLEFVLCYYACFISGAIALPVNIRFDESMVAEVLAYCKARVLITNAEFYQKLLAQKDLLNNIEQCYLIDGSENYPETKDFKNLLIQAPLVEFQPISEEKPALIYYTSGTTGLPKAVLHTHQTLMQGTRNQIDQIQISAEDSTLLMFPLCYLIGLGSQILPFHRAGGSVVLLPEFEPRAALQKIIEQRITKLYGFPKLYLELVNHAQPEQCRENALNFCFSGGEAIAPALQEKFKGIFNKEITEGCGMSELQIYCMNPPYGEKRLGSIGFPITNVEMKLLDERGKPVDTPNTIGEIIVHTASMTAGYWHNEALSRETIINGWFHTGDLAYRDAEGCYWFVSRKADIIKRADLLISPLEIENRFYQHPAVREAAAVALSRPGEINDQIIVFLILKAPQTTESLIAFANQSLSRDKHVDSIRIVNALPYGVTGKINRKELKKWAALMH